MKVTLKEIAELLGAKNTAAESGLNSFAIGQEVIIRTYTAGVWFGRLKEKSGDEVILNLLASFSLPGIFDPRRNNLSFRPRVDLQPFLRFPQSLDFCACVVRYA